MEAAVVFLSRELNGWFSGECEKMITWLAMEEEDVDGRRSLATSPLYDFNNFLNRREPVGSIDFLFLLIAAWALFSNLNDCYPRRRSI